MFTEAITLDTYSHVVPRIQAAAAKRFDEGMLGVKEASPDKVG